MSEPNDPLDAWLDSARDVAPSPRLQRAIAEIPLRHPHAQDTDARSLWLLGGWWKTLTAAALVCVLGVIAGASSIDVANDDDGAAMQTITIDDAELAFAVDFDEETAP